jgi:hypothetical protein
MAIGIGSAVVATGAVATGAGAGATGATSFFGILLKLFFGAFVDVARHANNPHTQTVITAPPMAAITIFLAHQGFSSGVSSTGTFT